MRLFKIFVLAAFILSAGTASAQRTPAKPKPQAAKFKPPKLFTSIGAYHDSVSYVSAKEAAALVSMPLKITDAKNGPYTVSSYNFLYRKIVPTEDDQMNKVSFTTQIKTSLFTVTPLPAMWITASTEDLKPGEEYFFFGIIAKDQQGRVMYAPDLKIIIK